MSIDPTELTEMEQAGFLVPADRDEKAVAEERYLKAKASNTTLGITISTGEACNISCGYCYQNDDRDNSKLRPEAIDGVVAYIEKVVSEEHRPHHRRLPTVDRRGAADAEEGGPGGDSKDQGGG